MSMKIDRTNWKATMQKGSADEGIDQILPADAKGKRTVS